jgi:hypothetical protein
MYKATVLFIALLIFTAYVFFSKPDSVVVNEKGKVEGLVNKARSLLQGERFWKLQLKMANEIYNNSIAPHLPSSAEMQALYKKMREEQNALNILMKELYTPEERMAETYRIKADSLERTARWKKVDETTNLLRSQEAEKYKLIIPVIEAKIQVKKTKL